MSSKLRAMAEATPATRDRYVDFLRAISILVVVVGHWFIARTYWTPRAMGASNMIGLIPGAWALTWILMVMPVFFFVGGFANATTLDAFRRRGEPVTAFLKTRVARLLRLKLWRALHALAIPTFILALGHGVLAGTDTQRPWMWGLYVLTGGTTLFLTVVRAWAIGKRPQRAAKPDHATKKPAVTKPAAPAKPQPQPQVEPAESKIPEPV